MTEWRDSPNLAFEQINIQFQHPSVENVFRQHDGVGPGFDHLRVGLAFAIMFWHSWGISYGLEWTKTTPNAIAAIVAVMLPMFFALSGFLVMGSALRLNNLRVFITFRVLRIVPALLTEITLSALILGPIITILPLREYFSNSDFWQYFGNVVGRTRYFLPGVFVTSTGQGAVNGSLWTVGPEILCYIIISMFTLAAFLHRRALYLSAVLAFAVAAFVADWWDPTPFHEVLPNRSIILCFLIGNLIYLYRDIIPFSPRGALACFAASIALIFSALNYAAMHAAIYLAAAGLTYTTVVIGLLNLPRLPFFGTGDYSYGIYIYAFPIQQSLNYFFPDYRSWWFNFFIAFPLTLTFAVASWHLIEKPTLQLRKVLLRSEPKSTALTNKHKYAIAGVLAVYGTLLVWYADVFPIQAVGHQIRIYFHPNQIASGN